MKLYLILIIVFICMYYYSRDIKLRLVSAEVLAGSYMARPRVSSVKTVVYFYLDSNTIDKFEKILNSILDQSARVDFIYISIDENIKDIPSYLDKIAFVDMQTPANHFRNSILKEKESNVNIIFLNSNIIYKKDFIRDLIQKLDKNTDPVISPDFIYCSPYMFNDSICLEKKNIHRKKYKFY